MTDKKKPVNSRRKGATAELEFAKRLTELGHPAERGQQRKGGSDSPDVLCPSLNVHWEVKFYKTCQMFSPAMLATWDAQALADCGGKRVPVIVHRWNGSRQWWVRVLCPERGPYWQALEDALPHLRQA